MSGYTYSYEYKNGMLVQSDSFQSHSITFGDGTLYPAGHPKQYQFKGTNTWDDWHLIPVTRPVVAQAGISTSFVDIPGRKDGALDLSEYMTGRPRYANRSGSFSFYVDNEYDRGLTGQQVIAQFLHGKRMKMCLEDDPEYYYEGRFGVSSYKSDSAYSIIDINYTVGPYKYRIYTGPWLWDPFNFETDNIEELESNKGWL